MNRRKKAPKEDIMPKLAQFEKEARLGQRRPSLCRCLDIEDNQISFFNENEDDAILEDIAREEEERLAWLAEKRKREATQNE